MRITESLRLRLLAWHMANTLRAPDFIVGTKDAPYLRRWYYLPRNRWFNIYLHEFRRDDEDRALHDHMYVNASIVLSGGYHETRPRSTLDKYARDLAAGYDAITEMRFWPPGWVLFRRPSTPHRISLLRTREGSAIPARTIFICGPRVREWGFLCPRGWRHWAEFTAAGAPGEVGKGCE